MLFVTTADEAAAANTAGIHMLSEREFIARHAGYGCVHIRRCESGWLDTAPADGTNRHFDSDIQTLAKLIADNRLGQIWCVHSRMDFDDPAILEAGPDGGLLRDFGSHFGDQMLWLPGPVNEAFERVVREGIQTLVVLDAARQSAHEGRSISTGSMDR